MLATLAAVVALGLPAGFVEAPGLEPAASFAAGKPVTVACAASMYDWRDFTTARGSKITPEGTASSVGGDVAFLDPDVCYRLTRALRKPPIDAAVFAEYLTVLVHESEHLRGLRDESETDCAALAVLPQVAHRFFHYRFHRAPLRTLMRYAWESHRRRPAGYRTVC